MQTGFFTMDFIKQISVNHTIEMAKIKASHLVKISSGRPENKAKALKMIESSNTTDRLLIGMANFMLAHPSEGKKVN